MMSSTKVFDDNYDVLKIVKSGYNINTATADDYVFHSGFAYHGVPNDLEGYTTYTTPSSIVPGVTVAKEITHNLGYIPDYHVFVEELDGAGNFNHLPQSYVSTSFSIGAKVSTTKLYIYIKNSGDSNITEGFTDRDYGFRYQIFNTGIIP